MTTLVRIRDSFGLGVYLCLRHPHCLAVFLFPFILLAAAVRLVFLVTFTVRLGLAFRCSLISAPVIQQGTCVGLEHTRRLDLRFRCFRDTPAVDGIGAFILETLFRGLGRTRRPLTAVNADLRVAWGMPRKLFFAFISWPRSFRGLVLLAPSRACFLEFGATRDGVDMLTSMP
jgi:hypothetical protein